MTDGEKDILAEQERDARPGPITPRDVFDALDELGGSADIVAARLLAEGHRGRRNECDACPLWSYLSRRFERPVEVHRSLIIVGPAYTYPPPAVEEFVSRFDAGEYPDLCGD